MTTSRRDLLRQGAGLAALLPAFSLGARLAAAGDAPPDRTLVVLQLSGGNDGLSTVVPLEDDRYGRARRTTAIRKEEALRLGPSDLGLHPNLKALLPAFDAGRMAVVLGAGYPEPNRSHFESMDIWHTGSLEGRRLPDGWLGRALDACCPGRHEPELSIHVGAQVPYALGSKGHPAISFERADAYRWTGAPDRRTDFDALNARREGAGVLDLLHRTAEDARASSDRVRRAAQGYKPKAEYPRGRLGQDLALVASLLHAGLPTRVAYVEQGGYDTHTGQRGRHDNLMRDLGDAVAAFLADVEAQGMADRVLLLAFSEFGRRVEENASQGTDHGAASTTFLFGKAVRGGLHGTQPSLADLDGGDLRFTTDFRRVYAAVLERWMGAPSAEVLGGPFEPLPVLA